MAWTAAAAGAVALALGLGGCGGSNGKSGVGATSDTNLAGTSGADTFNTASVGTTGKITWTIEKTVQDWNLLSADGNTFDYSQVLYGVYPYTFIPNPSYAVTMNSDLLDSAAETSTSPETITYKIKQSAVWSDGVPIDASDFVYAWQVQNGADANIPVASTAGYQNIQSVTGSDNGKTVTVVYKTTFPDWKSLFGPLYPAHIAKQHGSDEASFAWFGSNPPAVSGGPFVVGSVSSDKASVILNGNARYYGAPAHVDQVVFRAITDSAQEPTALQNHEVDGIYPQPQVDLVTQVRNMGGQVTYHINSGLSFEHFDFNLRNPVLGNKTWGTTLRTAMFTATNRDDIIAKTIKQFQSTATALNSRVLVANQQGYRDNVTPFGLGTGDTARAQKMLTDGGFKNVTSGAG